LKLRKTCVAVLFLICLPLICGCIKRVTSQFDNYRADQLYDTGQKQQAFELYLQAAYKGSAESQYIVSQMLLYGDGVSQNPIDGMRWLEKSAGQDYLYAARAFGLHLINGDFNTPKNPHRGIHLLTRAAAQKDTFSMLTLGYFYLTGYGTDADPQKAANWYRQAAQNGEPVPAQWQDAAFLARLKPAKAYNMKKEHRARAKRAQACLKALGYYRGAVDGIAGPGTKRAIKKFQKDQKVEITGRLDVVLMRQLYTRIFHDPLKKHL